MNDSSTLFCARRGHAGNFEFHELSAFQTDDMGQSVPYFWCDLGYRAYRVYGGLIGIKDYRAYRA